MKSTCLICNNTGVCRTSIGLVACKCITGIDDSEFDGEEIDIMLSDEYDEDEYENEDDSDENW